MKSTFNNLCKVLKKIVEVKLETAITDGTAL